MKDKSKTIAVDENDVAKATKTVEKFLKDFSANTKRLEQLDTAAKELEVIFPELTKDVYGRPRETHKIYDSCDWQFSFWEGEYWAEDKGCSGEVGDAGEQGQGEVGGRRGDAALHQLVQDLAAVGGDHYKCS